MWGSGVLGSSKGKEPEVPDGAVPHVYFPMRKGCRVTMYNDAHQVSIALHPSVLPGPVLASSVAVIEPTCYL